MSTAQIIGTISVTMESCKGIFMWTLESLGIHLEMDLMGQVATVFNFLRNCQIFSTATTPFYLQ